MKLLLIQLSDIHIKGAQDKVLARRTKIAEAVRNMTFELDMCIVAVTGDIAYAGSETQYAESLELFEHIRHVLQKDLGTAVPVHMVAIPGNHDCDFGNPGLARESIIKSMRVNNIIDDSIIDICTNVQNNFFELFKIYFSRNVHFFNKLYWEYKFDAKGQELLFRCYNTAWNSELREKPGEMYYPVSYIPNQSIGSEFVISMFHHPYNWLSPDNGREFRKKIEEVSDLIITGHEHDMTQRVSSSGRHQHNTYVEGGALQDSYNNTTSEFNCILIDTHKKRNAIIPFRWSEGLYHGNTQSLVWSDYRPNRIRSKNEFALSESMTKWLSDLGLQVRHPNKGLLRRNDIFVYPDLRDDNYRKKSVRYIKGEEILDKIVDFNRIIISGTDDAGKTTLAKQYFEEFYHKGIIPLYLNGGSGKTIAGDERGIAFILSEFTEQYTGMSAEEYRQLDKDKRIIIIDNFDKIKFKKGGRSVKSVVELMTGFAQYVILFSNDLALHASEMASEGFAFITEGEKTFQQYRIQPFGHYRRELLVKKWIGFDDTLEENSGEFIRKVEEIKKLLDTIIGNNYIPPYPVVLLPLLLAQQHNEKVNTNASTYGYFYELLIIKSLTERVNVVSSDVKNGYLTFLAKFMFEQELRGLTERQLREFHSRYEDEYFISVNYSSIIEVLIQTHLIEVRGDFYAFKYPYIFYYFIASSLRDRLSDDGAKADVTRLASTLHEEESANILLFLTHLTKDRFIIDQMIIAAKGVFSSVKSENMLSEVNVFSDLNTFIEASYEDRDVTESRDAKNKRLDEIEMQYSQKDRNIEEVEAIEELSYKEDDGKTIAITKEQEEYMKNIGVAMKTLQILGQLLKNYVGTMDGPTKTILVNECKGIGFRTLASLMNSLESNKEFFLETMSTIFRNESPNLTQRDATERAIASLFSVVHMNTYAIVKRISNAIGSPQLTQVYEKMIEVDSSPATQLVYSSLNFDHSNTFPVNVLTKAYDKVKNNTLALEVLKSLTFNQFYLFNTPFAVKQQACAVLKVKYINSSSVNPAHKMIKGGAKKVSS
ncbi:STAND family AAA ATPase [Hymenobacter weizhouensis]|uniref:STAND family AAA ATPase n=1 Tax=Hymenobacter sp. YIM 151500-1 TaxID=2987689 RepID=UPI002227C905|nr:metallophosphoesterase [Hymenobacter sp. YIM 151500-1]UYZ64131.1 metallophosphoesterase [Hymenobacter sp. YIM 151500-1]